MGEPARAGGKGAGRDGKQPQNERGARENTEPIASVGGPTKESA